MKQSLKNSSKKNTKTLFQTLFPIYLTFVSLELEFLEVSMRVIFELSMELPFLIIIWVIRVSHHNHHDHCSVWVLCVWMINCRMNSWPCWVDQESLEIRQSVGVSGHVPSSLCKSRVPVVCVQRSTWEQCGRWVGTCLSVLSKGGRAHRDSCSWWSWPWNVRAQRRSAFRNLNF